MTIHLIKSPELSAEVFTAVYDFLTAVDGPQSDIFVPK
jgi:hypothetical protein